MPNTPKHLELQRAMNNALAVKKYDRAYEMFKQMNVARQEAGLTFFTMPNLQARYKDERTDFFNMGRIYQSLVTGVLMTLVRDRDSGVNTFMECDSNGIPTLKKRCWTIGNVMKEQHYLVRTPYNGKLIEVTGNKLKLL